MKSRTLMCIAAFSRIRLAEIAAAAFAVVFLLGTVPTPRAQAQTLTVLYSFSSGTDGANPYAGLVMDKAGNLYGTTYFGGSSGYGTVFMLDITGTETVLHNFTNSPDGAYPTAGLVMDKAGNLYGTTADGGSSGYGTVFKLSPPQAPKSKEECEHGGYLKFGPPAGPFKNQGQCVRYVEHHKK
jgi:uncharacterized repeat protein (TIGR03803 family)